MDLTVLQKTEVLKSLEVLSQLSKKNAQKSLLSDDKENVLVQFAMKKIPELKNKIVKLKLPHSVRKPEQDICLFVKDLNQKSREHEITERHFKEMLSSKGIDCITQIVPVKSLKLEYKPFEAKRNLSNMFDLFVADDRIISVLPRLLGKSFYGRKKHPIQVNLRAQNLKKEIEKVVNDSRCIISGNGASSTAMVGHLGMSLEDLVDNVVKAVESIGASIPGGRTNLQSVYIRTAKSIALPLYVSFGSKDEVKLPDKPAPRDDTVVGDVSTVMHGQVKVTPWGEVFVGQQGDDGAFRLMKRKDKPQRIGKRKITEESDDEMAFETDEEYEEPESSESEIETVTSKITPKSAEKVKKQKITPKSAEKVKKQKITPKSAEKMKKQKITPKSAEKVKKQKITPKSAEKVKKQKITPKSAEKVKKQKITPKSAEKVKKQKITPKSAEKVKKQKIIPKSAEKVKKQKITPKSAEKVKKQKIIPKSAEKVKKQKITPKSAEKVKKQKISQEVDVESSKKSVKKQKKALKVKGLETETAGSGKGKKTTIKSKVERSKRKAPSSK